MPDPGNPLSITTILGGLVYLPGGKIISFSGILFPAGGGGGGAGENRFDPPLLPPPNLILEGPELNTP